MEPARIPLDRLTWARWRRVMRDLMRSEVGGRVKLLFGALLALLLAINGLNVVNSYVGRDFMTAIEQRSMSGFVTMAVLYVGVFAVSTVAAVIYRFTEERLGLLWRHWMTRALVERYLQDATYYRLRERAEIPNPDQRIADDVRTFTTTTLSLLLVFLNGTFTIVAFSGVMWSISPLLFAVAVGYAALGSGLTLVFGRPLLWLNYDQSDREASFRAELVHLRENAESVAFLRREGRIRERLLARIDAAGGEPEAHHRREPEPRLLHHRLQLHDPGDPDPDRGAALHPRAGGVRRDLAVVDGVLAPDRRVLAGRHPVPADLRLRRGAGAAQRARRRRGAAGGGRDADRDRRVRRRARVPAALAARAARRARAGREPLRAPARRHAHAGHRRPARPSIALFRATAGLWDAGEGRIVRPPADDILFLTERPYLPPGTLRQALVRTGREQGLAEARILEVLRELGVAGVLEKAGGLDVERDWDELLSLGEQQALSFARLALAAPRYAILDRPQTVLGVEAVAKALDFLAEQSITVVTFASDPALAARHDARIALAADGSWSFEPLRAASATA